MDLGLRGRVAIVGGASQGIGRATAAMLYGEGCRVAIAARTEGGANAATTITAGKNDTNAFAASAMPRSMNSFSSMRSQTRQKIVRSAQARTLATSLMTWPSRSRAPVTH